MRYNDCMELAKLHLDTYKVVQLLQGKGYTKKEAEGFIEAIQEISLTGVATKQDILDLKEATQKDIGDLRMDMSDLSDKLLRFIFANTVAIIGIMVAIQFIPAG